MVTMTTLSISCDDCKMQGTPACDDCVVTFLCNREPDEAVVIDAAEQRAMRLLQGAGLVLASAMSGAPAEGPRPGSTRVVRSFADVRRAGVVGQERACNSSTSSASPPTSRGSSSAPA